MPIKPPPQKTLPSNKTVQSGILTVVKPSEQDEQNIKDVIERGGKPVQSEPKEQVEGLVMKSIGVKFLATEGEIIDRLREARPKIAGKKITISFQMWIREAMVEKIQREKKLYGIK